VATPAASRISAAAAKNGSATTGYDQVTGLGTPKAAAVVNGLATYAPPVLSRSRRRARQAAAVAAAAKQKAHHSIARPGQTDTPSTGTPSPTPSDVPATASPVASTAPAAFASRDAFATATDPVPSALQQLLTTIAQGPSVGVNRTTTMAAVFTSLPDQASAAVIGGGSHAGTDGDAGPVSAESRVISVVAPVMAAVAPIVAPGAVAQASAADGPAAVAASETLSMAGLSFAPLDAASAFGDALALFAHESTQTLLPGGTLAVTAAGAAKEMKAGTLRAWAVTLGVLAADAILAGRWVRRRQRRRRRAAEEAALEIAGGLFSLAPVTSPALDELDDDGDGEYVI
jgi:hypothetical protein